MSPPLERAVAAYRARFGVEPEVVVRAPGRVNLIGEHTDYNDGYVLPMAIDRETVVAAGLAHDGAARVVAADFGDATDAFALDLPMTHGDGERGGWRNYVRGVAGAMLGEGYRWPGVRMAIAGNVPLGSGLSSSASIELAVARALAELAEAEVVPQRLAQLCQRAENDFVGCACGIMDQLVSACGAAGHALLIDCRSLDRRLVAMPAGVSVIVAHSGVRHSNVAGDYNARRAQCEAAARHYGVAALRDLTMEALEQERGELDDATFRRARHVVSENARTLNAADALERGDLVRLGALRAQSHASMRDDFAITVPAIDRLAAIMAGPLAGNGGARMTGGGFGGCVIAIAPHEHAGAVVAAVREHYRTPDGGLAETFMCSPSEGASRLR